MSNAPMLHENRGPNLVLAHPNATYQATISRWFHRFGWTVHPAEDAASAHRLTALLAPELLVLATELPDESGWLVCDKWVRQRPELKVILITEEVTPEQERFAAFVGAVRLLSIHSAPAALLEVGERALAV